MTLNIGVPQAILLALYLSSFAVCCVKNGEQSTLNWWSSAIAIAVVLALLAWGGFFS